MPNSNWTAWIASLSADTIGGSEKLPVLDVTAKYITPDLMSAYTIDKIHGSAVITALTDTHQLPVFTSGDDEKIITFANVSAWIVDELEAITTGTSIISGDKVLYVDGGVLKQIDIDTILAFINAANGTLGAQVQALSAATLADTDEYLIEQGGSALKAAFSAIAARVHDQISTYTAALSAVTTPADADKLYILQGSTAKYVTLTVLANTYLAAELDVEDFGWGMSEADPAASGDMLLMERSGTRYKVDIDSMKTYMGSGLQAAVLALSGLTAATPNAADLFAVDDSGTAKKITLANLETKLWVDYATYVAALDKVVTTASSDVFPCIQSGTTKYVTPVELATYFDVASGDVSGPVTTTENNVPQWDSTAKLLKDGLPVVPDVRTAGSALDTAIPTEQAVRESLASAAFDELDIDGADPIGEALAGTDLFIVDHGGNGTNRGSATSRIKDYIETAGTYSTFYVDSEDMYATGTAGAAAGGPAELGNGVDLKYFAFDGASNESVQFRMAMPEDWDRSVIRVKFFWSSNTGSTTADTVEWQIKAVAISNSDVLNATWGSPAGISDGLLADNGGDLQITTAVALTVGGTPQLGDMLMFEIYRNTGGSDTMTEDAWLFGANIQYNRNNQVDVWST